MDKIFTFITDLPDGINEMVTPCFEGFTVYIDSRLDEAGRLKAFQHAIEHIARGDFEKEDVQTIEKEVHNGPVF